MLASLLLSSGANVDKLIAKFLLLFIVAPLAVLGAVLLVRRQTGSTSKALLWVIGPIVAFWLIYQLAGIGHGY